MCPIGFDNDLLLLIYVYMLFILLIFSMSYFNAHYAIYHVYQSYDIHDQYLRSPMFIWTHILCSHICLAIVYIINLMHGHLHNDHISFYFYASSFDYMFRCQFSLKLGYILVQLVNHKQIIICLYLNAYLHPLDVLVQSSFDDSYILNLYFPF